MPRNYIKKKKPKKKEIDPAFRVPKKRGRRRVNMSMEEAMTRVRAEGVQSMTEYRKWWDWMRPVRLPKMPDRAYKSEWKGWPYFLGTNNKYPTPNANFWKYDKAKAFVHTLGLRNKNEWLDFVKSGKKPPQIPARPDAHYRDDWFSWKEWVGRSLLDRVDTTLSNKEILYIIKYHDKPSNVFRVGISKNTREEFYENAPLRGFDVKDLFNYDGVFDWKTVLSEHANQYWNSDGSDYVFKDFFGFRNILSDWLTRVT